MSGRTFFQAFALAAIPCVLWVGAACAQGAPDAVSKNTVTRLQQAADRGDAKAQYKLGMMYLLGYGVRPDYANAFILFRKSADQGYAQAQAALGEMYVRSLDVPEDIQKGCRLLRDAAMKGADGAQDKFDRWCAN